MRTLAQISDLHFGRHSSSLAEDLLASVNEARPDLVALSGDFTQRARHAEFADARRFLDRIAAPKLVVPGNHDVPLWNLFARFLTPLAKYNRYVSPLGLPDCLFRDEEMAVLGLNTARRFTRKDGRVSLEQIARIRRVFCEVPRGILKALVTHHPLGFPHGAAPRELAGRSLLALEAVAAAGVHLLLSGHHHRAASGDILRADAGVELGGHRSVLILHAGTAISTRTRGREGNSYNLVRIAGERVSIDVMAWAAGRGFEAGRSVAYLLRDDRWRAA
jgi:3',5'-cyclic AMP phosphodiesterase CpdA